VFFVPSVVPPLSNHKKHKKRQEAKGIGKRKKKRGKRGKWRESPNGAAPI
jgi:hypothetical protein